MADFPQLGQTNINPLAAFYDSQTSSLANDLARNTLDAKTRIASNEAQSGDLANQFAAQKNPLDIALLRQQAGLDPSPTLDKLLSIYNGGNGPAASPAGGSATDSTGGGASSSIAPLKPFVASNLPEGVDPVTDQIVRTVYGEAGDESPTGQQAVASVIRNRAQQSGMDPTSVIFAPGQFEPWNNPKTRAKLEALDPASPEYQSILKTIRPTLDGTAADPTGGATHFYSPTAQAALGRQPPSWGQGPAQVIGGHQFYKLGYAPGSGAPGAPPAPVGQQAPGQPSPSQAPDGPNHDATPAVRAFATAIMVVPAEQRAALYQQLLPAMRQAGAIHAPQQYPGDPALSHLASGGDLSIAAAPGVTLAPNQAAAPPGPVQMAGPGAPAAPASEAPASAPNPNLVFPAGDSGMVVTAPTGSAPAAPAGPTPTAVPNQNGLASVAQTDTPIAVPPNALAGLGPAPVRPPAQLMPSASAQPPASVQGPVVQPSTGINSPQVQQAQDLIRRATQIELAASATPNDPRARAAAAAMSADLKGRAALLMQADSVTVGPDGVQTHALTGKQDSAAAPTMNYHPDPSNPGVLISPGQKPVVLPPGRATTLPNGETWVTGPGGTFRLAHGADLEGSSAAATAAAGGAAAAASAAKTKDALIPLARTSVQAISNIDYGLHQLDEAAKGGIPTGYFAPALATAAAAAKSLGLTIPGVDPAAVSNIQTASKTLAVVSGAILQNILGPNAEITEGKIEAFIHAQPGIVNDPLATHRILNWARSQFTYDHEMAMDGLANVDPKSGQLSPGWQAGYITKHGSGPIFDSASGEMKQPDGQGPSRQPPAETGAPTRISDDAGFAALPSGAVFVGPDGRKRRKP